MDPIDIQELLDKLDKITDFAERDAIPLAAVMVKTKIHELTGDGLDAYGEPMKPYTKEYADRKRLRHVNGIMVTYSSVVNLRLRGRMLNAIELRGNYLGFFDEEEYNKAIDNMETREFFEATQLIADHVSEELQEYIESIR